MNIEKSLKQLAVKLGCCASETACQKNNIGEIIDFIADNYKGGGGGEVKFYPEVIKVESEGLSTGNTLTLKKNIDVGAYAIVQPYYQDYIENDCYAKRALCKCISRDEGVGVEITIKNILSYYDSSLKVGDTSSFWQDSTFAEIGDYIALYRTTDISGGEKIDWLLVQVTDKQSGGSQYYYEVVQELPASYNGEIGTVTIVAVVVTLEVLTILDAMDNTPYARYLHKIEHNSMAVDETTGKEVGTIFQLIFLLEEKTIKTSIAELVGRTPLSAFAIRKSLDDNNEVVVETSCGFSKFFTPNSQHYYMYFYGSNGDEFMVYGDITDTVTPL